MTESRTASEGQLPTLPTSVPEVLRRPGVFREIVAHNRAGGWRKIKAQRGDA